MLTELKVRRIVIAIDLLDSSRLALDCAAAIAHHFHASLHLVHAILLPQPGIEMEAQAHKPCVSKSDAQFRLEKLASIVRLTGVHVETHVEDGLPYEVVLQASALDQADLLVLGVRGIHRGLDHFLIGSDTEKLLLTATCPVLTIGAHVLPAVDVGQHFKKILYFTDFTPEATAAAPYALLLAREFKVPVEVCQMSQLSGRSSSSALRI
jgi:nucleotide-binding universal stress UspA family protein